MDPREQRTEHSVNDAPVPLTSDFVFKYVFGAAQSTEILRSLLSAVQEDAGYPAVATVQITNPFNQKDHSEDKLSVVDVKATDVTGATYTMEAQATWHAAFSSRALYYWVEARTGPEGGTCRHKKLCQPAIRVGDLQPTPAGGWSQRDGLPALSGNGRRSYAHQFPRVLPGGS